MHEFDLPGKESELPLKPMAELGINTQSPGGSVCVVWTPAETLADATVNRTTSAEAKATGVRLGVQTSK